MFFYLALRKTNKQANKNPNPKACFYFHLLTPPHCARVLLEPPGLQPPPQNCPRRPRRRGGGGGGGGRGTTTDRETTTGGREEKNFAFRPIPAPFPYKAPGSRGPPSPSRPPEPRRGRGPPARPLTCAERRPRAGRAPARGGGPGGGRPRQHRGGPGHPGGGAGGVIKKALTIQDRGFFSPWGTLAGTRTDSLPSHRAALFMLV